MAFEIKESRAFCPVHEKKKHEEMNESLYNSEEYTIHKNCIIISYNSKYSYIGLGYAYNNCIQIQKKTKYVYE